MVVAVAAGLLAVLARVTPPAALAWRAVARPADGPADVRLTGLPSGEPLLVAGQGGPVARPRPLLWLVPTEGDWQAVALDPASYYGERAALAWVARLGDQVAAIGEAFGGAHGLPRFSTWAGSTSGLDETPQAFELFGGPSAIGVTDLAVGPQVTLAVGSWAAGGRPAGIAVWVGDGAAYLRLDVVPGLRSTARDLTTPSAVAARGEGFVVAGTTTHLGGGRVADQATAFWVAGAGSPWSRTALPSSGESRSVDVSCSVRDCLVAGVAGVDRGRLALWHLGADGRASTVSLDAPPELADAPAIHVAGAWVSAETTAGPRLWWVDGATAWPVQPPPGPVAALATSGERLYALGTGGALWSAP
ncbi:hypothetical protein GCM10023145_39510 [Angustibacter luteus]